MYKERERICPFYRGSKWIPWRRHLFLEVTGASTHWLFPLTLSCAHGILVLQPGIELRLPCCGSRVLPLDPGKSLSCAALRTTLRNLNGKKGDISQWSLRVEPGFMPPQSFSTPIQYPGWSSWLSYQVSMNFLSCRPGCALATSKGHLRTWSERSSQELAMKWTKYSYLHRRACQKRSHLNVWSWGRGGWGTWYLDMGGISPRGEVEGSFSAAKYKKVFWVLVSILTPNMNFA